MCSVVLLKLWVHLDTEVKDNITRKDNIRLHKRSKGYIYSK